MALLALALVRAAEVTPRVAAYVSEATAAKYNGIHQEHLRPWLEERGCVVEVVGDAVAADAAALAEYDLVAATSTYVVPESACAGLAAYVHQGGSLLWMDGPAFTSDRALRSILGIGTGGAYLGNAQAELEIAVPQHPMAIGVSAAPALVVGNPATTAAGNGNTVARWNVDGATYPALVETVTGRGTSVLLNFIPWLCRSPQVNALLDNALDVLLVRRELRAGRTSSLRARATKSSLFQPEPARIVVKLYQAGETRRGVVRFSATLADRDAETQQASLDVGWAALAGAEMLLPTAGLNDGTHTVRVIARTASGQSSTCEVPVRLSGQERRRLGEQEGERAELLAPVLKGTLGDYDLEPRTPDGRVDIPRLVEQIRAAHMNMYDWLIWHDPRDWEDLQRFLPEAEKLGIRVWVTVTPPSEQGGDFPHSEPFRLDFIRWATEIGKLSRKHPCIVAFVIDDFDGNLGTYTADYTGRIAAALREQNPRVAFLPVIYRGTVGSEHFLEPRRFALDGVVFAYADLLQSAPLVERLEACRRWLGPNKLLMVNIYATGSSGPKPPGPRTAEYLTETMRISRRLADGIRIYCLPKDKLADDLRYKTVADLYRQWAGEQ